MVTNSGIPGSPAQITPEWLTSSLRTTGVIGPGATVRSFDTTIIGDGVGFIGQLAQLDLRYSGECPGPSSLVAKFPAASQENREIGNYFRYYEREIRFYEQIADEVELRTPKRYFSAMDLDAGDYVLLLENMAPARVGDQLAACSIAEADLAIRNLAAFHATWWQSKRLAEIDWMPMADDEVNTSAEDSYHKAWDTFVASFGSQLQGPMLKVGERLGDNVARILQMMAVPPCTIIHGDYRLDNLFFGTAQGGDPLSVIDWQIASRGRGVFDVAYFISGNLRPEDRRAHQMTLLKHYYDTLVEHGVRDYSWDQCVHDYRICTLFCLVYTVISGGTLDLANERGQALVTAWIDRCASAIQDLDCAALMPK